MGISPEEAREIIQESIRLSIAGDAADRAAQDKWDRIRAGLNLPGGVDSFIHFLRETPQLRGARQLPRLRGLHAPALHRRSLMFEVQIEGEYGVTDGSIHLLKDGEEVVMWDSAEWVEDPSLVYVIANAIRKGYEGEL
jgi:hypothetical protein